MKYIISFLGIIIFLFSSCQNNEKAETISFFEPKENIRTVMDSFVHLCNDTSLIYELYINKINTGESELFLYAGKVSTFNKHQPILKASSISNVHFYIYTGVEDYFNQNPLAPHEILPHTSGTPDGYYWVIKDSCDIFTIYPMDYILPFRPLPNRLPSDHEKKIIKMQKTGEIKEYM